MRTKVPFILLILLLCGLIADAQNPFEDIGVESKPLTLSKGKYQEFFDNDSVVRIGNTLFNVRTERIVGFIEQDTLYGEATLQPELSSRWLSPDPKAAEFPGWSPYVFVNGNSILLVDPDGQSADWYKDVDGSIRFDPKVKGQECLLAGQIYVGESTEEKLNSGGKAYYKPGGSIFFTKETDAYNRMWNEANRTNTENMAVIFATGVWLLPTFLNSSNTSEVEKYGFSFVEEKSEIRLHDSHEIYSQTVLGTIHTHQNPPISGFSAQDVNYLTSKTPNVPFFILEDDVVAFSQDKTIYGAVGTKAGYSLIDMGDNTREDLLKGQTKLIPFLKDYNSKK